MNESITFLSIAPEVTAGAAVVLLLLVEVTWKPRAAVWALIAGAGLAAATVLAGWQWVAHRGAEAGTFYNGMVAVDGFAALAGMLVFILAGLGLLSAWPLIVSQGRRGAEFIALVILAATGGHLMAAAADLIVLFIGLEVLSISLYILAGFTRERGDADEASMKYFLLGAFASAVFVYGAALVFAATGTTTIYGAGGMAEYLAGTVLLRPGILLAGVALLMVGMAFKVTAAPFHVWAPDVYQGAPGGVTGFLAAVAKVGGFAALARVLTVALGERSPDWVPAVAVLAALSVVVGTVLAIVQDDVKRLLAYSTVAHAGFVLIALVAGRNGIEGMWFYVATYAVQLLGAFAVAAVVSGAGQGRSPLSDYTGLGRRSPFLAATMTLLLLAMAGIPLTAGFVGKVAVFRAAIDAGYLWLVILAVLATVAGLYFYLRVIVVMYMAPAEGALATAPRVPWGARLALAFAAAATIVLGLAPWPLLEMLRDALPL